MVEQPSQLRIGMQKTDMIDMIVVSLHHSQSRLVDDPSVIPSMIDAAKVNATANPVDPDDDVDLLYSYS